MATEEKLLELAGFANQLADEARVVILPYWRQPLTVEEKLEPDRAILESPVTVADRNTEKAMRRLIKSRYPDHGIYGEELGSEREDAEWVWVLDPIDGTKSFITGKPLFGTLIACLHRGTPVVGVIDQCVLDERWVGIVGRGTQLNGRPVTTTGCGGLEKALLYATTHEMFKPGYEASRFGALSASVKRALFGADCYAYALLASGWGTHLVVEADLGLYDYCALVPVVQGAGGVITDWQGLPLTLPRHAASKGRVVAAANAELHEQAVRVLSGGPAAEAVADWRARLAPLAWLPPLLAGVAIGRLLAARRS